MTIYYPAHLDSGEDPHTRRAQQHHHARPTWLPKPRHLIAKGYGKFASLPERATMAFFAMTTMLTKLPAYKNARLAEHWPEADHGRENRKSYSAAGEPPKDGPAKPKFPLIMFSHGLGGSRLCYSSVCGELASHGFIVCAIEHRDGSGARTIVNVPQGSIRRVESEAIAKARHNVEVNHDKPFETVDFIFPKDDPYDTSPTHEIDAALRESQIQLRIAEIDEAYFLMQQICAGRGEELKDLNVRKKGTPGACSLGLDGVDFTTWKDRLHVDNVTIIGHSFGSATTVEMLRSHEKYNYITQGIIYDIWGMPVPEATPDRHISVPLLGVNSEAFMYWQDNFDVATRLIEEAQNAGQPAWLITVRGTVHISQSDFCILYPHIASAVMKTTMDPVRAIDVNIDASLDFLDRTLKTGDEQAFRRNLPTKKLLDLDLIGKMPTEHKPEPKWMAVRLKIQHERHKKLLPHAKQRYWEKLMQTGEEEVWVHIASGREAETGGASKNEKSMNGAVRAPAKEERQLEPDEHSQPKSIPAGQRV